jgi:hypothetical protein
LSADQEDVDGERSSRIVDAAEGQLQQQMVKAGIWLTFAVCAAGILYGTVTWDAGNRGLITVLFAAGILGGILILMLPVERILMDSSFRDAFFTTWSVFDIALISVAVGADGGAHSPFTLLFFLPMVFAAAFYPLRIFVPVGAVDVFAFLLVGDLYGHAEP